jgi:hypothetical protein
VHLLAQSLLLTGPAASRFLCVGRRGPADPAVAQPFDGMSGQRRERRIAIDPTRHQHVPVDPDILLWRMEKLALTKKNAPPVAFAQTKSLFTIFSVEKETKLEVKEVM